MNISLELRQSKKRKGLFRLLFFILLSGITGCTVIHKGYEKEIFINDKVAIHYGENIDELIPSQIAHFMTVNGYINPKLLLEIYLKVEKNRYNLKFVDDGSVLKNKEVVLSFNDLEIRLNSNLKLDKEVRIEFTNEDLTKTFALPRGKNIVNNTAMEIFKLKIYNIDEFHFIQYNDSMPISDVKIVGQAVSRLKGYFPDNHKISLIFINNGPDYTVKLFILKKYWNNPSGLESYKGVIKYFKDSGIEKKINLMFVDYETYEEIKI